MDIYSDLYVLDSGLSSRPTKIYMANYEVYL
jgi:hypothetical protein